MKKRGISPLIATVLLIGFAIVLAALVFRWGGEFFKSTTERTGEEVEQAQILAGIEIKIKDIKFNPNYGGFSILIENNVETPVDGFVVRATGPSGVKNGNIDQTLEGFISKWLDVDFGEYIGDIEKIEVFPKVDLNGNMIISDAATDIEQIDENIEMEIDSNVIAYWKFDEISGTNAFDSSGNAVDATLINMDDSDWVEGKFGNALNFDGVDDYVDGTNSNFNSFSEGTFSLWIKPSVTLNSSLTNYVNIISRHNVRPSLAIRSDGRMEFVLYDGASYHVLTTTQNSWEENTWYHLIASWGSTGMELYVDGVLADSNSDIITLENYEDIFVGEKWDFGEINWVGLIDEVMISDIQRDI